MAIIEDGATGKTARVNSDNTLAVHSITISEAEHATDLGQSYNVNTGTIVLTTAGVSGVLYFKNNENINIHVDHIVILLGNTTGGLTTDSTTIKVLSNPTAGTVISGATDADMIQNRNIGASSTLEADVYKGAEGDTFTDGEELVGSLLTPGTRAAFVLDITIPKGKSIGVTIEPNDSNTSMKVMAALVCHIEPIL
jgi:hypothetical protein